jgi:hypothetical protein
MVANYNHFDADIIDIGSRVPRCLPSASACSQAMRMTPQKHIAMQQLGGFGVGGATGTEGR